MALAEIQQAANGLSRSGIDATALAGMLDKARGQASADPSSNPILLFALDLTLRMDRGEIGLHELEAIVQHLTMEAFVEREARLAKYLGETSIEANEKSTTDLIEQKAGACGFDDFCAVLSRDLFGVVFTAHPTFSITLELARALAELAGHPTDRAIRDRHLDTALRAEHRPPPDLSLEVEHAWASEALSHAHDALEEVHRSAFRVARRHWPKQWTMLEPRMVTLASWVGYDQDGRTDLTWTRTLARLADKLAMLKRWSDTLA